MVGESWKGLSGWERVVGGVSSRVGSGLIEEGFL